MYTWRQIINATICGDVGLYPDRIALCICIPCTLCVVYQKHVSRSQYDVFRIGEHVDVMTSEVIKFRRLPTTGSDYRSRAAVVLSLITQLLMCCDIRAYDVNAVHHPPKQTLTGAYRPRLIVLFVESKQIQNFANYTCSAYNFLIIVQSAIPNVHLLTAAIVVVGYISARCVHPTNRCAIAMMFVPRPSVCLGRGCIVIILCTLALIWLHGCIVQCPATSSRLFPVPPGTEMGYGCAN